jgi:hydroxyacylglutathione hydrolase
MFLEMIRSEGLAHLSYIIGDGGRAAVIDPRRDCEIYIDLAYRQGAQISHIFETHRNEDYLIGSVELASRTGAGIFHGKATPFKYGNGVSDGDQFQIGDIVLTVLETPGHTYDSISITVADRNFSADPIVVFTGDALFIGDVGRTDFFPDRPEEVAGLLYDSIHRKLLPLGDHVILYPAHGAGSVCGSGMASREFSTLGYEAKFNRVLQIKNREEFIRYKVREHHYKPPYFQQMEKLNLNGPPLLESLPRPKPFNAAQIEECIEAGGFIIDTRSPEAFAAAFIPGSLSVPLSMIPAFVGYFLPYDRNIGLIVENPRDVETAVRYLVRLGYDRVAGYLEGGLHAWEVSGRRFGSIPSVYAGDLKRLLETEQELTLLDVRKLDEYRERHLINSTHIYLGDLPDLLGEVPDRRPIITFCGSGQRAIIAASILKRNGFENVENCLGSMRACQAVGCPAQSA